MRPQIAVMELGHFLGFSVIVLAVSLTEVDKVPLTGLLFLGKHPDILKLLR